jgi:FlaA1/EpsC-like NDP-sugar epimerase
VVDRAAAARSIIVQRGTIVSEPPLGYLAHKRAMGISMNFLSIQSILGIPRAQKRILALAVDVLLCLSTVYIAYYLRVGFWPIPTGTQWLSFVASVLLAIPLFITFGLYRAIFRYAGWGALIAVAKAVGVYGLLYSAVFTIAGVYGVPRTIGIIQPVILFIAIGGSRAIARYWLGGGYEAMVRFGQLPKVLIYGAGSAGRQLAAALASGDEMQVVGFVDDDRTLHGSVLNGKMIYPSDDLPALITKLGITDMLLALPSVSRRRRNEILAMVSGSSVGVRTLPGMMDLAQGRVTINDLRELDIEDMLGRDAVAPNQILLAKNITGKTVLVTGAGGSIGSELCRQILQLKPATLLLVEMSEFALYAIDGELRQKLADNPDLSTRILPLLASVQDEKRMHAIMAAWTPNTLYHAAAYKHVPLVEHNPAEGIRNNVFGTLATAQVAAEHGVQDFVLISTDKAVRPTNVMGTSKRLAEMVLQALAAKGSATRFSMVRFGNVLGSSGSVVPLFRKQIKNGGPITITHEEITRYFMTIPEAAQLVIQAGAMAVGGEVFVLDMGDPVKIIDLARKMIEFSGLSVRDATNPDGDMEIAVIGLRPGEKLYEELLIGDNPVQTNHPRIMKAMDAYLAWPELNRELDSLAAAMDQGDVYFVRSKLKQLVDGFTPDADVVDWVHLESAAG